MSIGKKIKQLRIAKGWDQPELARQVGGTAVKVTISQIETGKRNPGPELLKRLADVLNVSVEELQEPAEESEAMKFWNKRIEFLETQLAAATQREEKLISVLANLSTNFPVDNPKAGRVILMPMTLNKRSA